MTDSFSVLDGPALDGAALGGAALDDAAVAAAAARAGAEVVRALYGRRLDRIDKGTGDFATSADVAAEKAILGVIRAARPDDAVLGEEGGRQGAADAERQWLVDPLCGTLNYAAGLTQCAEQRCGSGRIAGSHG